MMVCCGCVPADPSEVIDSDVISEPVSSEQQSEENETSSSISEDTSSEAAYDAAEKYLSQMSLHQKICQLFILRLESLTSENEVTVIDAQLKQSLADHPVGGVVLFSHNIIDPAQTSKLIGDLQLASQTPMFIAVDEEGGMVARVANNPAMGTTHFPDMRFVGDTGDVSQAYRVGNTIGSEIKALGFNLDFAPVADVTTNPYNIVIGDRAFSDDPEIASKMVASAVKGFADAGMIATLKHFPGHGDTYEDSHSELAVTYKTLGELQSCELLPFAAGIEAGADVVMTAHVACPNIEEGMIPATMSKRLLTGILREQLGFEGIIITDAMEMKAIADHYADGEAALNILLAGADILLAPNDYVACVDAIEQAVADGILTETRIDQSVLRILRCKQKYHILSE